MQETNTNRFTSIIEKFYLNEHLADFHFLFKTNDSEFERIPAHKLLLTASNVFQTMFNGDWKERAEVEIVDASAADFKVFLQFFYLPQVNITPENVGFVMNLGNKYDVSECLTVCSKFLTNSITDDNVCTAYGLATFFNQDKLKRYCELIIRTSTKAVLSSNGFLECDRKMLKCILDLEYFSCSEVDVFEACMSWVKFKSGEDNLTREIAQEQLGELFCELDFKSMFSHELENVSPSNGHPYVVDELIDISQLELKGETKSNDKQRKSIEHFRHDGIKLKCQRLISAYNSRKPYRIQGTETTSFSVNEPVLLERIRCSKVFRYENNKYYSLNSSLVVDTEIVQVSDHSDEQILYNRKALFACKNDTIIFFSKPLVIRPNLLYEIRFKYFPAADGGCVVGGMLKNEMQLDSDITVKFHRDAMVEHDTTARGLIHNLLFRKI